MPRAPHRFFYQLHHAPRPRPRLTPPQTPSPPSTPNAPPNTPPNTLPPAPPTTPPIPPRPPPTLLPTSPASVLLQVLDLVTGGDMEGFEQRWFGAGGAPPTEQMLRFMGAQLCLALEHMHSLPP